MNSRSIFFNVLTNLLLLNMAATALDKPAATKLDDTQNAQVINLNFENASLELFLKELEQIFQVAFIYDSQVKPEQSNNSKELNSDIKITFRTNKPLNSAQAWAVVDGFLNLAGLARVPVIDNLQIFRITKNEIARKEAIPSFIGIDPNLLPESGLIRYVYFLKNSNPEQMKTVIDSLKSKTATLTTYQDLNALIFTDYAFNIKTLMQIVQELDSACTPTALSILKLKEADAVEVAQLYDDLKNKSGSTSGAGYNTNATNKNMNQSFLQESSVFAEPRTNTLIIIGPPEANSRIEKFITEHIDTKLAKKRSMIHTIELSYIPAEQIATIFNQLAQFGSNSEAAKFGGTRGGEKYFSRMFFEAEKQGNNLIVRGEPEDFLVVKEIIQNLDKAQPQVALDVLIVTLETKNTRGIGSQIDNKTNKKVNFQTSGFGGTGAGDGSGIQLSPTNSLAADLISLATSASIGSTVLSLGKSSVWALLSVLSIDSKTNVLANPFLVTTNKYPAVVSLGEERRIITETIQASTAGPTPGRGSISADLEVKVTPRINALGTVNMIVDIISENFLYPATNEKTNGDKSSRTLHTNASVADGEVLAIGGLSRNVNKNSNTSVPILSKIPIFGNFFKNKTQITIKESLIIFITPKIIYPGQNLNAFTQNKAAYANSVLDYTDLQDGKRDPIAKWLFKETEEHQMLHDFTHKHQKPVQPKDAVYGSTGSPCPPLGSPCPPLLGKVSAAFSPEKNNLELNA